MLNIPLLCEFRSMSRQTLKGEKDGKPYEFERVSISCESAADGSAFSASPSYGVPVPPWVCPELRGKKILLSINSLQTDKGNSSVRFSSIEPGK